jgi:hypothetical protein
MTGHNMHQVLLPQVKSFILFIGTLAIKGCAIICSYLSFGEINSKNILFCFFIFMMFLPECGLLFSKDFRKWVKAGVEDSDGEFNSSDLGNLLQHFSTLWCIRLYVLFGLLEAFYGVQVREIYVMGSLAGAFGIEAIGFLTNKKAKAKLP